MRYDILHPTTAIMNLFDRQEQRVILTLSEETGLSPQNVLRQALKMYQLSQVGDVDLPSKKLYDDSDSVMAALSVLTEDGYATDKQRATARAAMAEIERLREGEFSDEEFQHLCHCVPETDREAFFTGCADYQRSLLGEADRDRFVAALNELFALFTKDTDGRWCFNSLSKEGSKFDAAMEKLHELLDKS